ncbi:Ankyrin repeat domain-containing protein [Tetrabaena socialis]|uniref:Ankyrin repeat domain-containing protein n=1 Tax=Tetrabaena socialis TaxID=47790 RepID=A0A2J8AA41_9CHLO|nr:Ankyrin repeat domain-containing protein [Tetrabaena socialis]|eukprot:PNH09392.1 Ankyrin repeat domain-containing protein [Tetrabaena socialis]
MQRPDNAVDPSSIRLDVTSGDDPSRIWLPEVVHRLAGFLTGNELACTLRQVNKATAAQFRAPQHTAVRLDQPVPHHAFAWRWGGPHATRGLTVRQRKQLPCLTARSSSIANLQVLLARDDLTSPLDAAVLAAAAGDGQLEVCLWLTQQGCPCDETALHAAAGGGHKEVCEWLAAEGYPCSIELSWHAAAGGHQALCEWLLANGGQVDMKAAAAAARGGHVGLMDWLLTRTGAIPDVRALLQAAATGCDLPTLQRLHHTYLGSRGAELHPPENEQVLAAAAGSPVADWRRMVEWLERRGYPRTELGCTEAARRTDGRDRLRWLQKRGYPLTGAAARAAVQHGNAEALEFVLAQGVQLDEAMAGAASFDAARGGHLAALKVLHAHAYTGSVCYTTAAAVAARGHLPVVAWLVEALGAGAVLTADLPAMAAMSGNAGLLAWLHEHGCPWDANVFAAAARAGSEEQLEWLAERGCPMGDDGEPYRRALPNSDLATLRCLRRLGCLWGPVGRTFTCAVRLSCGQRSNSTSAFGRRQALLALPWLVAQGCPVCWVAAEREAAEWGDSEVLAWVRERRPKAA